jgi:tRNA G18 (ribose-2'-O)-methylase SpoU
VNDGRDDTSIYARLRDRDLAAEGICIGEGRFVVERMIAAPSLSVISVLCTAELVPHFNVLARGRFPVTAASGSGFAAITGYGFHRGVLAAAQRPLPADLGEFLRSRPDARRIAICASVSEVENMGSIVRSARAFGFDALVLGPGSCDPFNRKAVRGSAGGCFYIPFMHTEATAAARFLRANGFTVIGATPDAEALTIDALLRPRGTDPPDRRYAVMFGHEGSGLDDTELAACDVRARIPIDPAADSLNVGVAAGIFFHYLCRLR